MMEKMIALQRKRRSKKGGFTLVELIVVLVILAILAALLIPALTGYCLLYTSMNSASSTVENCIGNGSVTSNDGYAGGVASENYGTIRSLSLIHIFTRGSKQGQYRIIEQE